MFNVQHITYVLCIFPFKAYKCSIGKYTVLSQSAHTFQDIFISRVRSWDTKRVLAHVCENMTHFLGFRRGNLRPALRIFFVFSRAENASGKREMEIEKLKKGESSWSTARYALSARRILPSYHRDNLFFMLRYYLKRCTLSSNLPNEILSFFFLSSLIDLILWKSQWRFKFIRRIKTTSIPDTNIYFSLTKLSPIIFSQIYSSVS